ADAHSSAARHPAPDRESALHLSVGRSAHDGRADPRGGGRRAHGRGGADGAGDEPGPGGRLVVGTAGAHRRGRTRARLARPRPAGDHGVAAGGDLDDHRAPDRGADLRRRPEQPLHAGGARPPRAVPRARDVLHGGQRGPRPPRRRAPRGRGGAPSLRPHHDPRRHRRDERPRPDEPTARPQPHLVGDGVRPTGSDRLLPRSGGRVDPRARPDVGADRHAPARLVGGHPRLDPARRRRDRGERAAAGAPRGDRSVPRRRRAARADRRSRAAAAALAAGAGVPVHAAHL
ncbi:MAG: Peptidoglycan N-acetylglucosamine deacetylase, partial [uncultured Actinomycetospora sp.]